MIKSPIFWKGRMGQWFDWVKKNFIKNHFFLLEPFRLILSRLLCLHLIVNLLLNLYLHQLLCYFPGVNLWSKLKNFTKILLKALIIRWSRWKTTRIHFKKVSVLILPFSFIAFSLSEFWNIKKQKEVLKIQMLY